MIGGGVTSPITEWSEVRNPTLTDWPEGGWVTYQYDASYEKQFPQLSSILAYIRMTVHIGDVLNQRPTEKQVNLIVRDHERFPVNPSVGSHYEYYGHGILAEVSIPKAESCIQSRTIDIMDICGYFTAAGITRRNTDSGRLDRE